jgi:hypothetical protein
VSRSRRDVLVRFLLLLLQAALMIGLGIGLELLARWAW